MGKIHRNSINQSKIKWIWTIEELKITHNPLIKKMLFVSTNYTLCNVICNQQGNLCTSLDIEKKLNMNGKQKLILARVSFYIVAYITYVKYETHSSKSIILYSGIHYICKI